MGPRMVTPFLDTAWASACIASCVCFYRAV